MHVISIGSHHPDAATAVTAIGLARALAAAGHHVTVRDAAHRQAVSQALGVDGLSVQSLAPRLVFSPSDQTPADASVLVIDTGPLSDGPVPERSHLLFVLPTDQQSIESLPGVLQTGQAQRGDWLGLVLWDDGATPGLAQTAERELARDVVGPILSGPPGEPPSDEACAALGAAVSLKLSLQIPTPTSLDDLAGLKLPGERPAAEPAPQASQYTYVLDGAAIKEAGVSASPLLAPSTTAAQAPRVAPQARAQTAPVTAQGFGLPAVLIPWALAVGLAVLHLLRS